MNITTRELNVTHQRALKTSYTLEISCQLKAVHSIKVEKMFLNFLRIELSHKERMQYELNKLKRKANSHFKPKDQLKRIQMQQEIKRLTLHIKHHKKLYPEEYV